MKIAVCVSHVPDTATKVKIGEDGKTIDPDGVTYVINPYDEIAVEEALKTKEKFGGDSEVIILTVGPDKSKETIRKALAMGADKGVLLKDDNQRDSFGIAKALADFNQASLYWKCISPWSSCIKVPSLFLSI